jgi:hypothetical protein
MRLGTIELTEQSAAISDIREKSDTDLNTTLISGLG